MTNTLRNIFSFINPNSNRIRKLYKTKNYIEAYAGDMDIRIKSDYKGAIGGHWEEIGLLQFEFLKKYGLKPDHKLLDIGCGTLRGGLHFIKYLKTKNYSGFDISANAIQKAKELVELEHLNDKSPKLLVSTNKDLKFKEFENQKFDFLLAQSVFTHLLPEHIEECFIYVKDIMQKDAQFFFTYRKADAFLQRNLMDFSYPFSFFEELANKYGYTVEDKGDEYKHLREQRMVLLKLK